MSIGHPRQQWPEKIKLFLDAKRPKMKQRLLTRGRIEVPGLIPKREIGQERSARCDMFAELSIFIRQEQKPAEPKACEQNDHEGGKDSPHASRVEVNE
jgi:hypothetical protein